MGLDVILFALVDEQPSAELLATAPVRMLIVDYIVLFGLGRIGPKDKSEVIVSAEGAELWRFYSESYDRGPWADIVGVVHWLRKALPGCCIFYGPDNWYPQELTEAREEEITAYFFEHGNERYYQAFIDAGIPVSSDTLDRIAKARDQSSPEPHESGK